MENKQKGFIAPFLIVIILLIVIGGGIYFYVNKNSNPQNIKQEKNTVATTSDSSINNTQATSSFSEKTIKKSDQSNIFYELGLNGYEMIDITNLEYPECEVSNVTESNPQALDLQTKTGLIIEENERFYNVNGTLIGQLYYEVYNCTVMLEESGIEANAITETNINYNFSSETKNNKLCNISDVAVGLNLSYLLPKWTHLSDASGEIVTRWNNYYVAIKNHEYNHGAIAKKYAKKLFDYLNSLEENGSCISNKTIEDNYNQIINELNEAQDEYDTETDHGVNEGIFEYFLQK